MFKKLVVIGSGTMGAGIAQVGLENGMEVTFNHVREKSIEKGIETIKTFLQRKVEKGKLSKEEYDAMIGRLKGTTNMTEALQGADCVIEASPEKMELKKEIFKELDALAGPEVLLASNTSTLSITEIASVTKRPENVIGMHFFSPVPLMRLVEVVKGEKTSEKTVNNALELCKLMKKSPIVVKDVPGFIVNRFMCLLYNEAAYQVMDNVAEPEDIDTAMKLGVNHPMGPLEVMDMVGVDVCYYALQGIYDATKDERFNPCPLLTKMVKEGKLGKKSGEGFHKYN